MQYNYNFYLQPPAPERVRKRKREGGQKGAKASAPTPASDDTEGTGAPTPADLPDNPSKAVPPIVNQEGARVAGVGPSDGCCECLYFIFTRAPLTPIPVLELGSCDNGEAK